jgi:hypothetical protein
MTTLELKVQLPDELAARARNAGLLTDEAIGRLLEEALRRRSGQALRAVMDRLQATNIAPMTDEEIQAEVDAVRAERKARKARDAGGS